MRTRNAALITAVCFMTVCMSACSSNETEAAPVTETPIVSGYSGGPVFNLSGELIGISNAAYTGDLSEYDFDHLSLLIPINRVKAVIEENCAD